MTFSEYLTNPVFYDVFGIFIWIYVAILSIYLLRTRKKPRKAPIWILLIIAILGLIVDGTLVATLLSILGG